MLIGGLILAACGGGSSHSSKGANAPVEPGTAVVPAPALPDNNGSVQQCPVASSFSLQAPPPQAADTVSGRITFERIPFSAQLGAGLDYNNPAVLPARGVVVEALASSDGVSCDGAVAATTLTDGDGWYRLTVAPANVCIRVRAQLYRAAGNGTAANWNIAVADNTAANTLYVMTESAAAGVGVKPRRDLHAASGWSGSVYAAARAAAPFAILDTACKAMNAVLAQRSATQFGALSFFWSLKNTSDDSGAWQHGKIGGAFFDRDNVAIYLRGDADVNTDEFDEMVVAHEFGHFVTHVLSRSDSIGGEHSLLDYLDPRLAFDEGWATAFAGLVLGDPIYRDSDEVATANSPAREFHFDIRQRFDSSNVPTGWFSESSLQRLLYSLGTDVAEGGSGMGLGALLQTFAGDYKQTEALATIFSYGERLKVEHPAYANAIASALDMEQIEAVAITAFADSESHAPRPCYSQNCDLPVYRVLDTLGSKKPVCSSNAYGSQNMLSNQRYLRFIPPQTGRYRFNVQPLDGGGVAGFGLLDRGRSVAYVEGAVAGTKVIVASNSVLESGRSYVLSVFHVGNVVKDSAHAEGEHCFEVWAQTP